MKGRISAQIYRPNDERMVENVLEVVVNRVSILIPKSVLRRGRPTSFLPLENRLCNVLERSKI